MEKKHVSAPQPEPVLRVYCVKFWHWRAQRYLYAEDYGRKAWCFAIRKKSGKK